MNVGFADTFFFIALVNDRDSAHPRASEFVQSYRGLLVTTGWVLTELGDGFSRSSSWRTKYVSLVAELRRNPNVTTISHSDDLFESGLALYSQRPDKEWSLTDCISFVVMHRDGLSDALTGDHHFVQAGFRALLA